MGPISALPRTEADAAHFERNLQNLSAISAISAVNYYSMERRQAIAGGKKLLAFVVIALVVLVSDQVTKCLVATSIPLHRWVEIIPGFLDLVHTRNPGAAFGILADSSTHLSSLFLVLVSVIALVGIVWMVGASERIDTYLLVGLALFFGGAGGNLVDRVRFGEVIDFIDVYVGNFHWPTFNVGDASLCVGTALFFLHFLLERSESDRSN